MSQLNEVDLEWQGATALLSKWHKRARINQLQHYEAADYYSKAHNAIGIPVVILSSIVGTTVFATLQKQVDVRIQIAVGALSVIAAVLTALQTFLRYSERAEKHRSTAAAYAVVRHRLERVTNTPVTIRPPLKELIDAISGQVDSLSQSAPNVPERVWRRVQVLKNDSSDRLFLMTDEITEGIGISPAKSSIQIRNDPPTTAARQDPYRP
jgi:hypothetical protein